jgi:hypothetical protein
MTMFFRPEVRLNSSIREPWATGFQTIVLQLSTVANPPKRSCHFGRLQCLQNLNRCVKLSLIFKSLRFNYQVRSSLSTHKCCASFPSRASEK